MDWLTRAACADDNHRRWFDPATVDDAKAVCAGCPVRDDCLAYALEHVDDGRWSGVWGGLSGPERKALRRRTGIGSPHGTLTRYQDGCSCGPCREAGHCYYQDRRRPLEVAS